MSHIEFWDRERGECRAEHAYAGDFVRWCYEKPIGRFFTEFLLSRRPFNRFYGHFQSSRFSRYEIERDIAFFAIPMDEYEDKNYRSYTDFFLRRFRPGARPFVEGNAMPAPAEGKYLAFERITPEIEFPVKGRYLNHEQLLQDADLAREFEGGPMLICRLCPIDYHYFHFPDEGEKLRSYRVGGRYHSVNILALQSKPDIFLENEREVTLLETKHFGPLVFIEVGAFTVGKIIQTHSASTFQRGEQKGHFEFGASTVIILGKPGFWSPSLDLLEQTRAGRETHVKLGTEVALQE